MRDPELSFADRHEAGRTLAKKLSSLDTEKLVILALPRGGVPVAAEIARELNLNFDVILVRKIGHPRSREYGIGAIAEEDVVVLDAGSGVKDEQLEAVLVEERRELSRRLSLYRNGGPLPTLEGHDVLLVDDGLATGVTIRAAIALARRKGARKIYLGLPVCASQSAEALGREVDGIFCIVRTPHLLGVGNWYHDFSEVSDAEVLIELGRGSPSP